MKTLLAILLLSIWSKLEISKETAIKNHHLSQSEVESILGEPATLSSEKDSTGEGWYLRSTRTYTAQSQQLNTNNIGHLYYRFERFTNVDAADKLIDGFSESNKNSVGYEQLSGVGEEGFFHTDKQNFCVYVVRKGKLIIYMKVNKLTSKTNIVALKKIGMEVVNRI